MTFLTTSDELHQIVNQGENARVEFKAEASEEVIKASIHPENMLMDPGLKGVRIHLRKEMYQILLSGANEKIKKRASLILQSLRQMGWYVSSIFLE